jgi:hypothetical protein
VVVYDPLVSEERLAAALPVGEARVATSLRAALDGVDACIVTTSEPEFLELERLDGAAPLVVDGRRTLSPEAFGDGGYVAVGRRADA